MHRPPCRRTLIWRASSPSTPTTDPRRARQSDRPARPATVKFVAFDAEPETLRCTADGVVQAMIGQRVYFYGYLGGLVMHSLVCNGKDATMKVLDPTCKTGRPWRSQIPGRVRGQVPLEHGRRRDLRPIPSGNTRITWTRSDIRFAMS